MDNEPRQSYFAGDTGEQIRFGLVIGLLISVLWIAAGIWGYLVLESRIRAANDAASIALAAQWAADGRAVVAETRQGMIQAELDTANAQLTAIAADALAVEEYYRGGYDVCVFFATSPYMQLDVYAAMAACSEAMSGSFAGNWHLAPSSGWAWPLPVGDG